MVSDPPLKSTIQNQFLRVQYHPIKIQDVSILFHACGVRCLSTRSLFDMDWTNIHAWKSKSLFAHNIQKNRKDVKPYPIKLDNGPLSLAICLGTMVATFMFFAKVPVATVCLTAY